MKNISLLLIPLLTLSLSSCFNNPTTPSGEDEKEETPVEPVDPTDPVNPVDPIDPVDPVDPVDPIEPEVDPSNVRMQDRPILHCWGWSMATIYSHLEEIRDAGFKAIQTSPMQPQKDYCSYGAWGNEWWKLYQPLGFEIAKSNENVLGTKDELQSVCQKAGNLGIDVIVDVVSNHLAGGSETSLNYSVQNYESEIYSNNLIHTERIGIDDNNTKSIVRGQIGGYPDLMTEDERVQKRVLHLLKDYLDIGVDGFRFDAAKHIETEYDGEYASNFWTYVLGGADEYAATKGYKKPFYYGEILNTPGNKRSYSYYTDKMSVCDNKQGENILNGVIKESTGYITENYYSKVNPDHLVLWGESHDTYANTNRSEYQSDPYKNPAYTMFMSNDTIVKAYVMQASRKDAATLFFDRPTGVNPDSYIGAEGDTNYKSNIVKAANKFHNEFVGKSETVTISENCFTNVRSDYGAIVVRLTMTPLNEKFPGLKDGTYVDLITGKEYTVKNSFCVLSFTNGCAILIAKDKVPQGEPYFNIGSFNEIYSGTQTISVSMSNVDVTYSVNNGPYKTVTNDQIVLDASIPNGKVNLRVEASGGNYSAQFVANLIKTDALVSANIIVFDVNEVANFYIWTWVNGSEGRWIKPIYEADMFGTPLNNENRFIVVEFPSDVTDTSKCDWSKKIRQTEDIIRNGTLYSFGSLNWKD